MNMYKTNSHKGKKASLNTIILVKYTKFHFKPYLFIIFISLAYFLFIIFIITPKDVPFAGFSRMSLFTGANESDFSSPFQPLKIWHFPHSFSCWFFHLALFATQLFQLLTVPPHTICHTVSAAGSSTSQFHDLPPRTLQINCWDMDLPAHMHLVNADIMVKRDRNAYQPLTTSHFQNLRNRRDMESMFACCSVKFAHTSASSP